MTPEDADKAQQWAGMDGATAWHLIERHADDWNEIGEMMNAWLRANVAKDREACAKMFETDEMYDYMYETSDAADRAAAAIRERG